MDADAAKKRLVRVRVELEKQRREGILGRHHSEKAEVEMAHLEEIEEFNKYWD